MNPLISVVIPAYNAANFIVQTIDSVLSQSLKNYEIIVIDDGSTDNTAEIIKKNYPMINLVMTKNQGVSAARNLGTKIARGEFLQYLDADDLLADNKFSIQIQALSDSGVDVAYGNWTQLERSASSEWINKLTVKKTLTDPEIELFTHFWCPPAVYLFKKTIVDKVGGFSEKMTMVEDAKFVLDCALNGAQFIYCDNIMAHYRKHFQGSLSNRNPKEFSQCVYQSATDTTQWWVTHGGITEKRKQALIEVYEYVARSSFINNRALFNNALQKLENLQPGYVPNKPISLKIASQLLGYPNAELLAFWFGRCKSKITKLMRSTQ